jgi:Ni,Fe-hydrogenase maturation factor
MYTINDPSYITLTTITLYPNWKPKLGATRRMDDIEGVRGDLAIDMLTSAREKGLQILVVDGGSSSSFYSELQKIQGIKLYKDENSTMGASRRIALLEASKQSGTQIIVWTEPEKASLIEHIETLTDPIIQGKAEVVLPQRDNNGYDSYPKYQATWEKKANHKFNELLRDHKIDDKLRDAYDVWIGPRIIKNEPLLINIFTHKWLDKGEIDAELWANTLYLPIIFILWSKVVIQNAPRIVNVPIAYRHPAEQTKHERNNEQYESKRRKQFENIIGASELFIQLLERDKLYYVDILRTFNRK